MEFEPCDERVNNSAFYSMRLRKILWNKQALNFLIVLFMFYSNMITCFQVKI